MKRLHDLLAFGLSGLAGLAVSLTIASISKQRSLG